MQDEIRRPAAVILGILEEPPHGVIFVERAAHLRSHGGQIGLPGGGMDEGDAGDLRATALREMHEEVGVHAERVTMLATLPEIRARVNRYAVTPFVATVAPGELRIDASETVGLFTVPLATLLAEVREGTVSFGALEIDSTILDYGDRRIWGLTGRILRDFVDAWSDPGDALRDLVEARLRR